MTYAIIVRFEVKAEGRQRFLDLINENATASVAVERGCRRFDVLAAKDGAEIYLYEIYDDGDAFAAHLAAGHYKSFDAASADLVISKQVVKGTLFENAKGPGRQ